MVDIFLTAFVWDAPADTFCIETLPWRLDHLAWEQSQTVSLYPRLLNSRFRCINNPLIDLLFVECAADSDISSAAIKLDFVFHPFESTGLVTIQVDTAAAIVLDAGSAERNALYAVPLGDEFELQCEADVAAYMRRLIAWSDTRSPCPATWITTDCHIVEQPPGFQLYLWTIRGNFIYF
jgi:hypothetical protein